VVFRLRAVLGSISSLFWRPLLAPNDTGIAQLQSVLQVAFRWEDMHLHRFEIRGRKYGLSREGGMFFDSRKVRIGDLKLPRMERKIALAHQSQVKSLLTLMRSLLALWCR
jgi:hypothetical protein